MFVGGTLFVLFFEGIWKYWDGGRYFFQNFLWSFDVYFVFNAFPTLQKNVGAVIIFFKNLFLPCSYLCCVYFVISCNFQCFFFKDKMSLAVGLLPFWFPVDTCKSRIPEWISLEFIPVICHVYVRNPIVFTGFRKFSGGGGNASIKGLQI